MAHILLAEDDSSMRRFISTTLTKAGHTVEACHDGLDALEKMGTEQQRLYDLLLTDIVMPGMDGVELSKRATDKHPDIKVMFITGFAAVAMKHKKPQQGTKMLSKPFHLKQLVSEVDYILQN
mgnify:FL=1